MFLEIILGAPIAVLGPALAFSTLQVIDKNKTPVNTNPNAPQVNPETSSRSLYGIGMISAAIVMLLCAAYLTNIYPLAMGLVVGSLISMLVGINALYGFEWLLNPIGLTLALGVLIAAGYAFTTPNSVVLQKIESYQHIN